MKLHATVHPGSKANEIHVRDVGREWSRQHKAGPTRQSGGKVDALCQVRYRKYPWFV